MLWATTMLVGNAYRWCSSSTALLSSSVDSPMETPDG